jgi:DNA-binding IclR family transcriptional regulator
MANQSIQKAIAILSLFSLSRPKLKLAQIAKEMNLPLATAHGLVRTLVDERLMAQYPETKEYRLGLRLNELGAIQMASLEINQRAAVPSAYLARETGFVVHVAMFERDAIVVTYSTSPLTDKHGIAVYIGTRVPTYCSSIGQAVLAFLPREEVLAHLNRVEIVAYTPYTVTDREIILAKLDATRELGYAVVRQELSTNLCSIGAPVFGANSDIMGGISLNIHPSDFKAEDVEDLGRRVIATADQVSSQSAARYEPRFRSDPP